METAQFRSFLSSSSSKQGFAAPPLQIITVVIFSEIKEIQSR